MKDPFEIKRKEMLESQILSRFVRDPSVLKSMGKVPRHLFVPESEWDQAYGDFPLLIGNGQTISQPYIVALMTELLDIGSTSRVLEIGTGSGYQTAVLAEIAKEIFTVEFRLELYEKSRRVLDGLGYRNIQYRLGDGNLGWPEFQPYDGIIVTAAPEEVPPELKMQLKERGRMIIPVGDLSKQSLLLIKHQDGKFVEEAVTDVRFVKLVNPRSE